MIPRFASAFQFTFTASHTDQRRVSVRAPLELLTLVFGFALSALFKVLFRLLTREPRARDNSHSIFTLLSSICLVERIRGQHVCARKPSDRTLQIFGCSFNLPRIYNAINIKLTIFIV